MPQGTKSAPSFKRDETRELGWVTYLDGDLIAARSFLIWPRNITSTGSHSIVKHIAYMTNNRLIVAFQCHSRTKVKAVSWC